MASEAAARHAADASDRYRAQRVRHELVRRRAHVLRSEPLGARMLRITLGGDELAGFRSDAYDDHVKLFFPVAGAGTDATPAGRDFTPRRFDAARNELTIDFALHDAGPASDWARRAQPGDALMLGGPRGSMVTSTAFDWYLLAGDATALPAIGRRLDEAPAGTRMVVVVEVAAADDWIALPERSDTELTWVYRNATARDEPRTLLDAVRTLLPATGFGHVFAAGEVATVTALRRYLAQDRGLQNVQLRVASYWKDGAEAHHENLDAA
jgi:NADPH-dependent ferric siderophore reductase